MNRQATWMRAVLVCCLLLAGCQSQPADGPVVTLESGMLVGSATGDIRVFRGIPYAAPPVGGARWRAPAEADAWHGVRNALAFAPACPQPERQDRPGGVGPTSEDCLYLNVWAPAEAQGAPVMVWIHGGAFRVGAGSQPVYDGTSFAANGVILVTFNYRLGRLGFFAHPALEESGNFGLMDQAAALAWVQRNIGSFGGDPDNVTVFGEGAGGASVLYLLTSPRTEGLFQRAIVQSGGGLQLTRHLSERRGLRPSLLTEGVAWQGAEVSADVLRALPVEAVIGNTLGGFNASGPVIDGNWVVADPGARLAEGRFRRVPVMVGSNSHEASVLAAFGLTPERAVALSGVKPARVKALYGGDGWEAQAWGDAGFVAGARLTARSVAHAGLPAYLYHFDYVLEQRREKVPGAGHGSETPFVFNTLDRLPGARLLITEADRAMARRLHSHWLSFARTGHPAGGAEGYWPRYNADVLLHIGEQVEMVGGFRREPLDFFETRWRKFQER